MQNFRIRADHSRSFSNQESLVVSVGSVVVTQGDESKIVNEGETHKLDRGLSAHVQGLSGAQFQVYEEEPEPLEDRTLEDLRKIARDKNVSYSGKKKDELVEDLRSA